LGATWDCDDVDPVNRRIAAVIVAKKTAFELLKRECLL